MKVEKLDVIVELLSHQLKTKMKLGECCSSKYLPPNAITENAIGTGNKSKVGQHRIVPYCESFLYSESPLLAHGKLANTDKCTIARLYTIAESLIAIWNMSDNGWICHLSSTATYEAPFTFPFFHQTHFNNETCLVLDVKVQSRPYKHVTNSTNICMNKWVTKLSNNIFWLIICQYE